MKQRDDWHLTDDIHYTAGQADPFAAAVRATRMPMVITDPSLADNPIVFANEAFQKLTGYPRNEIIGRNCRFLQGPNTDLTQVAKLRLAIAAVQPVDVDLLNYRKDGSTFWNALYLSPVFNENGVVQFFFASQMDVTDRVEAQSQIKAQKDTFEQEVRKRTAELEAALQAKTLLIHEVDHRVKNNLTMIGSLLRLQSRRIENPALRHTLETMLERVDALASVHRELYQLDDIGQFDIGGFVGGLLGDVIAASGRTDITIDVSTSPLLIPTRHAAAYGLLLNELFTNAIKHGFADGRSGLIKLKVRHSGQEATITIEDDGHGMPEGAARGLGRGLVERLARQVDANVIWTTSHDGTTVVVTIPTLGVVE